MKPDEDMLAAVEEADLDPCDLYTDLGTLIVEGRIPGLTDKGFGEGQHCPRLHAQSRHKCTSSSPECQKYEQILKHMLLLWKNGIPMTIEVLLYPNCCFISQNVESIPDISYILLEQWTVHMLPKRVPDANISPRGLIQAVRSFLYFSQLCAWFSLTGGKSPKNIHYRICVPGEAFSSKFSCQPDCHMFPIANVGRCAAMKILVKSHPRCGEIPTIPCFKHSQPPNAAAFKAKCSKSEKRQSGATKSDAVGVGEYSLAGIAHSGIGSPTDTMLLGESLLDPPNSLCMYLKRYQSPSRCGSPSMEVPEHLMFGKVNSKQRDHPLPQRSRPQRRPVVERFLRNNGGGDGLDECRITAAGKSTTLHKEILISQEFQDVLALRRDGVLDYCCLEDCMKDVSREEMEEVLERLCEKNGSNVSVHHLYAKKKSLQNKSQNLSYLIDEMEISSNVLGQNKELKKNAFYDRKELFPYSQARVSDGVQQNCRFKNEKGQPIVNHLLSNKLNVLHSNYLQSISDCKLANLPVPKSFETESCKYPKTYQQDSSRTLSSKIHPKQSCVNIKKWDRDLQVKRDLLYDEPHDERDISSSTLDAPTDDFDERDTRVAQISLLIPSAEKKALFKQSLDSATSLVFHQRSGLPLTSSPAPVRKSGTCFDFDSSLTSVSAIKRALFEKESGGESQKENADNLSSSTAASIVSSSLLGTFEESVLNGRLEPVSTVEGFTAEIGASGSFCPRHITLPVTVFFYTLQDMDKVTSPYMGHINLRDKEYHIPKRGTVQVTLFNPHQTVVKMFVVRYDLTDMPVNCQTFLRQRTLYMPLDAFENDVGAQKWLRYLIHLRFMSSKSGRIYLHSDIRVIIFQKSDLDAATVHSLRPYELRSFIHGPLNPKFSSHKPPQ